MKEMIIGFGLTTAVIVGVVLYYRKKNKLIEVWKEEEDKFELLTPEEALETMADHLKENREKSEPSPPTEGFQGLPDKAPIDDIAEKAIQNYKLKKNPANRRRKKRSGK